MQINVKKTYLLVIDNDKKHREQEPAPLLTINLETLQAFNLDDVCRYLGYWGKGNGDMRATKEVVIEGEAAMSAPPFFQSVGRGDLLLWGKKEGPTVVIWESLSEQER